MAQQPHSAPGKYTWGCTLEYGTTLWCTLFSDSFRITEIIKLRPPCFFSSNCSIQSQQTSDSTFRKCIEARRCGAIYQRATSPFQVDLPGPRPPTFWEGRSCRAEFQTAASQSVKSMMMMNNQNQKCNPKVPFPDDRPTDSAGIFRSEVAAWGRSIDHPSFINHWGQCKEMREIRATTIGDSLFSNLGKTDPTFHAIIPCTSVNSGAFNDHVTSPKCLQDLF